MKLANNNLAAMSRVKKANSRNAAIVTAATTLTEVLGGGKCDASLRRVLRKVKVVSINPEQARAAGELLGRTGLSGHRCALDALLAVVALSQPRPVVLLTSDTNDMTKLTEELGRPAKERVAVVHI